MEAPEKLYFFNNEPILKERSVKRQDANIEYTRTDAFIEKAANWLRCHPSSHYDDLEEFANAFKKAMKLYD